MKKLKQRVYLLFDCIFHMLKTKRQILFVCFEGRQYGDNPRAIGEYVHSIDPSIKLFWSVADTADVSKVPLFYKTVKHNSIKYAYIKNKSSVVVGNGAGVMLMQLNGLKNVLRPFIKKKNQFEIATWHGTPLKFSGKDIPGSTYTEKGLVSSANVFLAASSFEKDIYSKCFCNAFPIDITGHARNDILMSRKDNALIEALKLPQGKHFILYAPTFRENNIDMSGIEQILQLNTDEVLSCFHEKFGGDWAIICRFHNLVLNDNRVKEFIEEGKIISGNVSDDMADYLSVSDVLVTDYSSSFFDLVVPQKPCFLFIPDFEDYMKNRGIYLNFSELPFPSAVNIEAFKQAVKKFDIPQYKDELKQFENKLGLVNNGNACKVIYDKYILPNLK